jgi:hypothetical protein
MWGQGRAPVVLDLREKSGWLECAGPGKPDIQSPDGAIREVVEDHGGSSWSLPALVVPGTLPGLRVNKRRWVWWYSPVIPPT